MIRLFFEADDSAFVQAAGRLKGLSGSLGPALQRVGQFVLESTAARFDREVSPDGSRWAALAPSTARRKRGPGRRGGILFDTGRLRNSVTVRGAPGAVFRLEPPVLELGTAIPYGAAHQFGASIERRPGKKKTEAIRWLDGGRDGHNGSHNTGRAGRTIIPARPFLGLSADDEHKINLIFQEWLEKYCSGNQE
jgi:phage gpG-like protein